MLEEFKIYTDRGKIFISKTEVVLGGELRRGSVEMTKENFEYLINKKDDLIKRVDLQLSQEKTTSKLELINKMDVLQAELNKVKEKMKKL